MKMLLFFSLLLLLSFLCFCYATANKVIKRKKITKTKAQNQSQTKVLKTEKHMQYLKRAANIFGRKNI